VAREGPLKKGKENLIQQAAAAHALKPQKPPPVTHLHGHCHRLEMEIWMGMGIGIQGGPKLGPGDADQPLFGHCQL